MRITNSMIVNNLMRNLNNNMNKLDKFNNQLATGRKYAHISDDPVALIYGQAARNKMARLGHYKQTIGSAQDWLRQVEFGVRDLQERVADIYVAVTDAATDVNNATDKRNIAQLVAQLRDHYVDTLNTTFGDKFVFAGYNTPGSSYTGKFGPYRVDADWNLYYNDYDFSAMSSVDNINLLAGKVGNLNSSIYDEITSLNKEYEDIIDVSVLSPSGPPYIDPDTGKADPPFRDAVDTAYIENLENMIQDYLQEIAKFDLMEGRAPGGPLYDPNDVYDEIDNPSGYNRDYDPIYNKSKLDQLNLELDSKRVQLGKLNDKLDALEKKWDERAEILDKLVSDTEFEYSLYDEDGNVITEFTIDDGCFTVEYDPDTGLINVSIDFSVVGTDEPKTVQLVGDSVNEATNKVRHDPERLDYNDFSWLSAILQHDVLSFDVGPGISMPVTFNGMDMVIYTTIADDGQPVKRNIFNLLQEVYDTMMDGDDPQNTDKLDKLIKELQDAQNHLLAKTAEVGGRTRRLDLLETRYNMDAIGYEQMRSDAEDVEEAEVIMYLKMAEAIYQASLAAGARIIQPTLMDFLR